MNMPTRYGRWAGLSCGLKNVFLSSALLGFTASVFAAKAGGPVVAGLKHTYQNRDYDAVSVEVHM